MLDPSGESRRAVVAAIRAAAEAGYYETGAEIAVREGIWICVVCGRNAPALRERTYKWQRSQGARGDALDLTLVCEGCRHKVPVGRRETLKAPEPPAWWLEKKRRGQEARERALAAQKEDG